MPRLDGDSFSRALGYLLPALFANYQMDNLFLECLGVIVVLDTIDPLKSLPSIAPLCLMGIVYLQLFKPIVFLPDAFLSYCPAEPS